MLLYVRFGPLRVAGYENTTSNSSKCPDGVRWMWKYFAECAVTPQEQVSEYLGLLSMLLWMLVGIPQIIKNFRHLDGLAGISFFLLFQWAGGDVTNLVGSILTHQLKLQIYLALYFVATDCVLLGQYTYFYIRRLRRQSRAQMIQPRADNSTTPRLILCVAGLLLCSQAILPSSNLISNGEVGLEARAPHHVSRALLSVSDEDMTVSNQAHPLLFQPKDGHMPSGGGFSPYQADMSSEDSEAFQQHASTAFWHNKKDLIGYAIGIVSSIFYLGSRLAQIAKNVKTKSTEGLAFMTFFLAVLGNLAYGLQIIVNSQEREFLLEKTPWLVGSLGVIGLDCTLLGQFYYYKKKHRSLDEMRQSLVNNEITINGDAPSINGPTPSMNGALDVEKGEAERVNAEGRGQQVY